MHFSTDCVFDGLKNSPYAEGDPTNPASVYGQTKLAGEEAIHQIGAPHLILRTAWLYGTRGRNFLLTILRLASQREELRIVNDQVGTPTWCREIANATTSILQNLSTGPDLVSSLRNVSGTYHMTASGTATWFDFAQAIRDEASRAPSDLSWISATTAGRPLIVQRIVPITTAEYPTLAQHPAYSVLSNEHLSRTFNVHLPGWRVQLHSAFSNL